MTGIHKGIKQLSQVNILIAIVLLAVVFLLGPTLFILNMLTHCTGRLPAEHHAGCRSG
jgi:glycine betaine transporter